VHIASRARHEHVRGADCGARHHVPQKERSTLPVTAHIPPTRARSQHRQGEALRLRRTGLSYRAIGAHIGTSHSQARRLVEAAFAESAERTMNNSDALLGEACDRVDGLIRASSAILYSADSTPTEKLRAVAEILRCQEARVRWLGLAAPERLRIEGPTRDELAWADVQGLSREQLDEEARSLGWIPVAEDRQDEPAD
jgi:hypothetical protein